MDFERCNPWQYRENVCFLMLRTRGQPALLTIEEVVENLKDALAEFTSLLESIYNFFKQNELNTFDDGFIGWSNGAIEIKWRED